MNIKSLLSGVILSLAIFTGGFVIWDMFQEEGSNNDALESYLDQDGIEQEPVSDSDLADESSGEIKDETGISPGYIAPEFELTNLNGETVNIKDFQGQFVILNMWASWCGPCRKKLPDYAEFHETYKDEDVVVIGVNMTSTEHSIEAVETMVSDFELPFEIVLDEDGSVRQDYEILVTPTTYMIDPEGHIAVRRQGYFDYESLENYYKQIVREYDPT
ncbi:peroxiredoxin family protein [Salisediminibacterium beveridgei]|nr:TlpA disulfide reductase family protein [Salisediminibacterium beveridgei]